MTVDQLSVDLVLDDSKYGPKLDTAGAQTAKFGMVAKAGVAVGVAAVVALGAAIFDTGRQWEQAGATIRAGTGATGADLDKLKASAKGVFASVPGDANAAATAIADLNTRTGQTGAGLESLAVQTLNLSRVTGSDLSGTIAATTRVFGDWAIATDKQSGANDFLFKTSQATGIGIEKLAGSVVQVGAPMRQLGFTFEETAALMGKFEQEGVNSETVMAGLKIGLSNLAEAGGDIPTAFAEASAAIKNAATDAEATGIAMEIFGKRSGPDMAAAIREGRFEIGELVTALGNSTETINQAAQDTLTLGDKFDLLTNKASLLLEPIGSGLVDALSSAVDWLIATGSEVGAVVDGIGVFIGELAATNEGFAGFVTGAQTAINLLKTGLLVVLNTVGAAFQWVADISGDVWTFFKSKGEKAAKDLGAATKGAADETTALGREVKATAAEIGDAETKTQGHTTATKANKSAMEAAEKAAERAGREYAALGLAARAASLGVEAFLLPVEDSPLKLDGLAEAARNASGRLLSAQASGDLAAPSIEWVGRAAFDSVAGLTAASDAAQALAGNQSLVNLAIADSQAKFNAANLEIMAGAGAFKAVGFEAGELAKPGGDRSLPAVSTAVTNLGKAIVDTITGGGSLVSKAKGIMVDFGKTLVQDVVETGLKPLISGFTELIGLDAGLKAFGKTVSGFVGGLTGGAGNAAGNLAGGAGSVAGAAGNLAGGAGSAGGAAGAAAGQGLSAAVGVVTGAVSAVSDVISNFQFAAMNKSLDIIVLHTLQTANDLANLRKDEFTRSDDGWFKHFDHMTKLDVLMVNTGEARDWVRSIDGQLSGGVAVTPGGGSGSASAASAPSPMVSNEDGVEGRVSSVGRANDTMLARPTPGMEYLPGDTSGLNGRGPGRSRTGALQNDPVYQDSVSIMDRNPLAVAAAQAGNVLASLATGGLFLPPSTGGPAAVEDPATLEAIEDLTNAVETSQASTQTVQDPAVLQAIMDMQAELILLKSGLESIGRRPIRLEINGREIATAIGEELDEMRLALA